MFVALNRPRGPIAVSLCLLCWLCADAANADPLYIVFADYNLGSQTSGTYELSTDAPSINEAGHIVYTHYTFRPFGLDGGYQDQVLHYRDGARDLSIVSTTYFNSSQGRSGTDLRGKAINDNNQVLYNRFNVQGGGLVYSSSYVQTIDASGTSLTLDVQFPNMLNIFSDRNFNDSGQIVYRDGTVVEVRTGSTTTSLGPPTINSGNTPVINDLGDVLWLNGDNLQLDPVGPTGASQARLNAGSPYTMNNTGDFAYVRLGSVYRGEVGGLTQQLSGLTLATQAKISINDVGAVLAQGQSGGSLYFA